MLTKEETRNELFTMGHTGCSGCAQSMSVKLIMEILGKNTIATSATGCLEVFSTRWPESSWKIPWIHSLFENSAAVASGVEAALKYMGKKDGINVIAQGGDGGTAYAREGGGVREVGLDSRVLSLDDCGGARCRTCFLSGTAICC